MPALRRKKPTKEYGDDKIYHYGGHKRYDLSSRPGYKKRSNSQEEVRTPKSSGF